jgi:CBS domain-containing protein
MMVENNCGEIPVVLGNDNRPIGVVTDRDITCRAVAQGRNPLQMKARECMTTPVLTVTPEMSLEECCRIMEERQIRRVPVVDERGSCCGIIAQADIALKTPQNQAADVVKDISRPA